MAEQFANAADDASPAPGDTASRKHWPRWLFAICIVPLCWLAMMAVHELGHVLAAWTAGATVEKVVLHPLAFSRTDVGPNDSPRWIVWMGPAVGVVVPILLWLLVRVLWPAPAFLFRFFAGFCLLANGLYLGVGWIDRVGDAGDLIRLGTPPWLMMAIGFPLAASGLMMWHKLAADFGFGRAAKPVSARLAIGVAMVLVVLAVVMMITG